MSTISKILPDPPNNATFTLNGSIGSGTLSIVVNEAIVSCPSEGVIAIFAKDSNGTIVNSSLEFVHYTSKNNGSKTFSLTDTGDRGIDGSYNGAQAHSSGDTLEFWTHSAYHFYTYASVSHDIVTGEHNFTTLYDADGNEQLTFSHLSSAVNNVNILNTPTGLPPTVSAVGDDADIDLALTGKGTGKVNIDTSFTTIVAATDGATVTFDCSVSQLQTVTLGGNRTLAVTNPNEGQKFMIKLIQDGTGSRTVTWFSTIKWQDGITPTLTQTLNKADWFGFICTGSGTYDGFVLGQNF